MANRRRTWTSLAALMAAASLTLVGCASTEKEPKASLSTWNRVPLVGRVATTSAVGQILPGYISKNGRIAFTSNRGGSKQIWAMNADGSNQVQLTFAFVEAQQPSWSTDGRKIAFVGSTTCSNCGGSLPSLYVMNADGSGQKVVTTEWFAGGHLKVSTVVTPAWLPDGQRIAFHQENLETPTPSYNPLVIRVDGSGETLLDVVPTMLNVDWSHDGARLVYDRNGQGISVTGAPSTSLSGGRVPGRPVTTALTTRPGDRDAQWSPDDSRIVFNRSPLGDGTAPHVFVMGADGSKPTDLTHGVGRLPAWSPDGKMIAFGSKDPFDVNNNDIYVMNADGTGRKRLTTDAGLDYQPSWQPQQRLIVGPIILGESQPPILR